MSPAPRKHPKVERAGKTWAGEALSRQGGLRDSTAIQRQNEKTDRSSTEDGRQYLFIENTRRSKKIGKPSIVPSGPGEIRSLLVQRGQRWWHCSSRQHMLPLPHLTRRELSLWTGAAPSPGRCSVPRCHTQLGMPEPFSPNPSFSVYCL